MNDLASAIGDQFAWFEYREGIKFKLRLVDRKEINEWLRYSRKIEVDRVAGRVETTNPHKWLEKLTTALVDWKGLNGVALKKIGRFPNAVDEQNYVHTPKNAKLLLESVMGLETWVFDRISEVQRFQEEGIEEQKKS